MRHADAFDAGGLILQGGADFRDEHAFIIGLDDDDVVDGMALVGRPMTEPTVMSYSLLRIRLCEISRNLADRTPLQATRIRGPAYEVIMDIDTEMQALLNDIPSYFSMSVTDICRVYNFDSCRATSMNQTARSDCTTRFVEA